MIRLVLLAALMLPSLVCAELEFESPRIKNLPPSVPVRAGYVTLVNPGSQAVTIVGARSEAFASVEFHRSVMQDGTMRMEQMTELVIPAGGRLPLEPGGLHLMLMQPAEPTKPGESIDLLLEFDDGSTQGLTMTVIR